MAFLYLWYLGADCLQSQMTRNVEVCLRHVPYSVKQDWHSEFPAGNRATYSHSNLPGIVTGIVLASGRIFSEAAALHCWVICIKLGLVLRFIFSITSPISIFRQAETLAVHIWKVNSEGTIPDGTVVSAGSAAVLLIFILIFNFGARKLGSYLHKKLTSA